MLKIYRELTDVISPGHTAVLVVDMQHDFCDQHGVSALNGFDVRIVRAMIPAFSDFITHARHQGVTVVFLRMVQGEAYTSAPLEELKARHGSRPYPCAGGSPGTDFVPELQPEAGELVVTKHRYSAFIGTDLEIELRRRGVETIIVCGVSTNLCVESTCRDGFMRDFYVVVPEDLTACGSEERQRSSIYNLEHYFAIVASSRAIIENWESRH